MFASNNAPLCFPRFTPGLGKLNRAVDVLRSRSNWLTGNLSYQNPVQLFACEWVAGGCLSTCSLEGGRRDRVGNNCNDGKAQNAPKLAGHRDHLLGLCRFPAPRFFVRETSDQGWCGAGKSGTKSGAQAWETSPRGGGGLVVIQDSNRRKVQLGKVVGVVWPHLPSPSFECRELIGLLISPRKVCPGTLS